MLLDEVCLDIFEFFYQVLNRLVPVGLEVLHLLLALPADSFDILSLLEHASLLLDGFLLIFKKLDPVFGLLSHEKIFLFNTDVFVLLEHGESVLDGVEIVLNILVNCKVLFLLFTD